MTVAVERVAAALCGNDSEDHAPRLVSRMQIGSFLSDLVKRLMAGKDRIEGVLGKPKTSSCAASRETSFTTK